MMYALLLLIGVFAPVDQDAAEPWVLHYRTGSNWGPEGVVWMNSDSLVAVADGRYTENIPCQGSLDNELFLRIDRIVQELIYRNPVPEPRPTNYTCDDELRINISIALTPENPGTADYFQSLRTINYSPSDSCNQFRVHPLWHDLAAELKFVMEARKEQCQNSPFFK